MFLLFIYHLHSFTTKMDISYNKYSGTATNIMENGSPEGVMTAESTINPTTA